MAKRNAPNPDALVPTADYDGLLGEVVVLLESARRTAARTVNAVMTATYWEIGRRIVEVEQRGGGRADYGEALLKRLTSDLTARFGRGFSDRSLYKMRLFYLSHPEISPAVSAKSAGQTGLIRQTPTVESGIGKAQPPSAESPPEKPQTPSGKLQTVSAKSQTTQPIGPVTISDLAARFPPPWSHYVRLLAVKDENACHFYEQEALRGGWSIRQLDRQIGSQFYERTLLSRNKAAMLRKGSSSEGATVHSLGRQPQDPEIRQQKPSPAPAGRQTRALAQPSCHPDWGSERGRARVAWVILGLTPPGYERSPPRGWENTDDLQPVNPRLWVACGRCERKPL